MKKIIPIIIALLLTMQLHANELLEQARSSIVQQIYYRYNVSKNNPHYLIAIRNISNESYTGNIYQATLEVDWVQAFGKLRFLRGYKEKGIRITAINPDGDMPMIMFMDITSITHGKMTSFEMGITKEYEVEDNVVIALEAGALGMSVSDFNDQKK